MLPAALKATKNILSLGAVRSLSLRAFNIAERLGRTLSQLKLSLVLRERGQTPPAHGGRSLGSMDKAYSVQQQLLSTSLTFI